ncbi:MAG: histidine kinase [Sphingomonas sp.]|nr:histidine kinase [Sphingomonas sp.]RZV49314.1 MAG: sensor histidine kinase [Sphingomonadaceae bacterium]
MMDLSRDERRQLRRWALTLSVLLWLGEIIYLELRLQFVGSADDAEFSWALLQVMRLVWAASAIAIGALVYLVIERYLERPFWQIALMLFAMVIAVGTVHSLANRWAFDVAFAEVTKGPEVYMTVAYWLHLQLAWAALILALLYSVRMRREQLGRAQAQANAQKAEIQALRYQVNPHFLFNTLNSVSALVLDERGKEAESILRRLSEFLRGGLSADPLEDIPLEEEVAQQLVYLDIERSRFGERIHVETDIDPTLGSEKVPSFILQPLVENAVKYAVARSTGPVTVRIEAKDMGDRFRLAVTDDGDIGVKPSAGTGTGLRNVRERLHARYGDDFDFDAGPLGAGGYRVELTLPRQAART